MLNANPKLLLASMALAEAILGGEVKEGDHVTAKVKKGEKKVTFKTKAQKPPEKTGASAS